MRAAVIAIGDELTTGQRLDTNSQWLSQRLTELGVDVAWHLTVADELEDNVEVFRTALGWADVVLSTGGLGPTADDLTREAIAQTTGTPLVQDPAALAAIEQIFSSHGRPMPARNQVQANFPEGALPIPNPHGTAPGIEMTVTRPGGGTCTLFALPGVPSEMHAMWEATVAPRIKTLRPEPQVTCHRLIRCFGAGESTVEAMLPDLLRRDRQPRVGITVSQATITLRITATDRDQAACQAAMQPTVDTIHQALGQLVFGEGEDELQDAVVRLLAARQWTVAAEDWATKGLLAQWLAEADPEGQTVRTPERTDASSGAPKQSAETAIAIAETVRRQTGADVGLGLAAFPAMLHDPQAIVHAALVLPDGTRSFQLPCSTHPSILRPRTAKQALDALRLALL
jgi:nicotinamide-nucleotide amidase